MPDLRATYPVPACLRQLLGALALALAFAVHAAPPLSKGVNADVHFDGYSPLAKTQELFFRELGPLAERRALAAYAERKEPVPEYTVDPKGERFAVFVPSAPAPARGYGLLVFVPPWPQAAVPRRWRQALEETGTLFVTAAKSGNDQLELPRRMALALHGYGNMAARYRIDPERVYVGGFSGGARVAERLALGYPDVFRGAILDSSSDDIGTLLAQLPAPPLLQLAQERLRLVYLYGTEDVGNVERSRYSMQSAETWCLPEAFKIGVVGRGHEPADAVTMLRALRLQEASHRPSPTLAECRARRDAEMKADVAGVQALVDSGLRDKAIDALRKLDERYGHYAGEDIQRLAESLRFQ